MKVLVFLLIVLHYAIVVEVIFEWLRYRTFRWVLEGSFITSAWCVYTAVVYHISSLLNFNTFQMVGTWLICIALARLLIRGL